jgi:hypothetical protein
MRAACHARFAGGISAFGTAICRGTREAEQAERITAAAIMTIAEERLGFMDPVRLPMPGARGMPQSNIEESRMFP